MFVRTPAMLQHFCVDEEDYFFGNIGDMVAGTFQFTENAYQVQARERTLRMPDDIVG